MTNYTIQAGDNLTQIAKAHNTTVQELARLNNITAPNKIKAGQTIKLAEDVPVQQQVQADTNEEIQSQLEATQRELEQMQSQMSTQNNDTNAFDIFGYGLAGAATYEIGKEVLPYAWKGTKKATNATVNAGKKSGNAVANGATKATNATVNTSKQAGNAIKTLSTKSSKIMSFTKAGKFVGKRLPVVGIAVASAETYHAAKQGGTKAAVKQGAKSASGLACGAAGAKLGAAIGTVICPGVGTAIGGVIGGVAGYVGGEEIASKVISLFT